MSDWSQKHTTSYLLRHIKTHKKEKKCKKAKISKGKEWEMYISQNSMQLNSIYRFKAIPIKISGDFFVEIDNLIVKFIWKFKEIKTILKQNKVEGLAYPNFKTDYSTTVTKTVLYWYKDKHVDQRDRIESAEINPQIYSQIDF